MKERFEQIVTSCSKNVTTFAKDLDVSHTAVSRVLQGETLPSSKILIPLGEKFGISVDWLLFGIGEMMIDPSKKIVKPVDNSSHREDSNELKELQTQIKHLEQRLKDKDSLIEEKDKQIESKDEIINLLKSK
ncbi:helix-turn-helix domain-containing protein [Aureispira sp. CCB-QB1]|uniref:helix-turn-helix domain-containing protein n=1 Tax=Aureispira sp. CCB-QB1 TaxID=1313421 RepID=UPI000696D5FC|nr:helix-turn-helix domain-containing protein [Aureispira sp. CCB-QB1]